MVYKTMCKTKYCIDFTVGGGLNSSHIQSNENPRDFVKGSLLILFVLLGVGRGQTRHTCGGRCHVFWLFAAV